MLRKNKSNAAVISGRASSPNLHNVLQQYSGHATACLAPTLANAASTPNHRPLGTAKFEALTKYSQEMQNENTPPLRPQD